MITEAEKQNIKLVDGDRTGNQAKEERLQELRQEAIIGQFHLDKGIVTGRESIDVDVETLGLDLIEEYQFELNCKVERISYDNKIIECHTNKEMFKTKNCIVTVPLGVLKENKIAFSTHYQRKR